jgi:peptidoglycan/LPS O-acetylase OafA/YrhL
MNTIINTAQYKRLFELDALRGIAALAVVLFHFTYGYDNGFGSLSSEKFYFRYGNMGVDLFFIISGFVIFMTLKNTKTTMDFFVSRFSRLYPAYWAAIILTVVLTILLSTPLEIRSYTIKQVLVNFTMLQSFFKIKDVDGAYWTLAIELTFYFWMWFIFKIKKLNYIEWCCVAWITLSLIISFLPKPFKNLLNVIFIARYASLFIAGILFYLLKNGRKGLLIHVLVCISLLTSFYYLQHLKTQEHPNEPFDIVPFILLVLFYVVFYLFAYNKLVMFASKPLLFLGGISYSLYLIHENIGYSIIYWSKKVMDIQLFYIPITIIITIGLVYLINRYIEIPVMNFIRKRYKVPKSNIDNLVIPQPYSTGNSTPL